ncbi:rhamnogalacturonan lyase [Sphingomonas cannabina]|uniref:rhamnogalacturonan lyase n=1 Tax=Sphingomonas cannabina TaxID=2899123 RepID=UPI001F338823|nr:rhamnogalacturonan lyase [Sphingomonas cannabina]UIJ45027.1 rhamnogalacturonan lyase [Sphingomonas cannabina]
MRGMMLAVLAAGVAGPALAQQAPTLAGRQVEALDRGLVAVPAAEGNHVSWRLLGSDAKGARFTLYRDGKPIAEVSGTEATSVLDKAGSATSRYTVAVAGEKPGAAVAPWAGGYLAIPLDKPADRITPDGETYGYTANDASVGDLDGDGRYELIVKWYPTIAKDNAFSGYTGETLIDAYTLDGKRLWRIDLGRNIRSGAHYTQFMVYDVDGDGRAEVAMKTADGTIDGTGKAIGDASKDWRSGEHQVDVPDRTGSTVLPDGRKVASLKGRILAGPEYLTVFDGRTGRALATQPYAPPRDPRTDTPTYEQMAETWGDGYGNRSERYLAGVAYLDGHRPSLVFGRGYYARSTIAAWDYRGGKLVRRWLFDSAAPGNEKFAGQGNHQLSVADVDGDGRDEVIYGSMAIDDDGKGLWSSGLGHGDAMHVSDLDPDHPGLEKFGVHENMRMSGNRGAAMLDARTGAILWSTPADRDTGRGIAIDIDPRHPGAEAWASNAPDLYDAKGQVIPGGHPRAANFGIWWDGDRLRELLDGNRITKWDWTNGTETLLLEPAGTISNNGTKRNPALSADILGDWREELVLPSADSRELRIYTTPIPTTERVVTLMHDPVYRLGVAWQNTAYNQPPHLSYFFGAR